VASYPAARFNAELHRGTKLELKERKSSEAAGFHFIAGPSQRQYEN
jgi:hypothetical protein